MERKGSSDKKDKEKIVYVNTQGYRYTEDEWFGAAGCVGVFFIIAGSIASIIGYIIGNPVLTLGGGIFIITGIISVIRYQLYKFRKNRQRE